MPFEVFLTVCIVYKIRIEFHPTFWLNSDEINLKVKLRQLIRFLPTHFHIFNDFFMLNLLPTVLYNTSHKERDAQKVLKNWSTLCLLYHY